MNIKDTKKRIKGDCPYWADPPLSGHVLFRLTPPPPRCGHPLWMVPYQERDRSVVRVGYPNLVKLELLPQFVR